MSRPYTRRISTQKFSLERIYLLFENAEVNTIETRYPDSEIVNDQAELYQPPFLEFMEL
jgi:hypothetical protein